MISMMLHLVFPPWWGVTNRAVNTTQAVNTVHGVFTTSTQVNAANSINIDNLSDAVICSFFA
ncbi:hypothetical protein Tco_0618926, partial [Tanacetum coccineum]